MEIEIGMSAEKLATEWKNPHYIGNGVLEIIDTVPAPPPLVVGGGFGHLGGREGWFWVVLGSEGT